ncbi:hypothetical protein QQX13_13790, partial [Demequina sp. SYSU T00068]
MAARRGSTRAEAFRLLGVGRLLEDAENAAAIDELDNGDTDTPNPHPDGAPNPDPDGAPNPDPDGDPDPDGGGDPDGDGEPDPDEATPDPTPTPTPPPPRHPHVAAALAAGDLSVEAASQITVMLDA